jgi:hypothetical protein
LILHDCGNAIIIIIIISDHAYANPLNSVEHLRGLLVLYHHLGIWGPVSGASLMGRSFRRCDTSGWQNSLPKTGLLRVIFVLQNPTKHL